MHLLRKVLLLFVLTLCLTGTLTAQVKTITLQEYAAMLREIATRAEEGVETTNYKPLLGALDAMDSSYVLTWRKPGGLPDSQAIDTRWMSNLLFAVDNGYSPFGDGSEESEGSRAEVLAESIREHVADLQQTMGLNPGDTATGDVRDILDEQRYQDEEEVDPSRPPDLDWLDRISQNIESILTVTIILLVAAGLIFLLFRLGRYLDLRRKQEERPVVSGGLLRPGDPTDSASLLEAAKSATDLATRVRYSYLTFIIRLHETGVIPYQPSWTAWEYYREILRMNFPSTATLEVTNTFDRTAYGDIPVTAPIYENFEKSWRECMSLTKGGTQ